MSILYTENPQQRFRNSVTVNTTIFDFLTQLLKPPPPFTRVIPTPPISPTRPVFSATRTSTHLLSQPSSKLHRFNSYVGYFVSKNYILSTMQLSSINPASIETVLPSSTPTTDVTKATTSTRTVDTVISTLNEFSSVGSTPVEVSDGTVSTSDSASSFITTAIVDSDDMTKRDTTATSTMRTISSSVPPSQRISQSLKAQNPTTPRMNLIQPSATPVSFPNSKKSLSIGHTAAHVIKAYFSTKILPSTYLSTKAVNLATPTVSMSTTTAFQDSTSIASTNEAVKKSITTATTTTATSLTATAATTTTATALTATTATTTTTAT
eukprot:gene583-3898_t